MKIELKFTIISVCAITLFLIGFVDNAEAAAYIKFDGIDGEAQDKDHKGWSDLLSFQQAAHKPGAGTGATRSRAGVVFEDIVVVKEIDKSSPKLAEAIATGKTFPQMSVHFASSAGTYFAYELKNVIVTSYSIAGTGNDKPTEQVSLNFEEIKVTYTEMDSAGKSKGKIEYSWKVEEGTK